MNNSPEWPRDTAEAAMNYARQLADKFTVMTARDVADVIRQVAQVKHLKLQQYHPKKITDKLRYFLKKLPQY